MWNTLLDRWQAFRLSVRGVFDPWVFGRIIIGLAMALAGLYISHAMDGWEPLLPYRYNVFRALAAVRQAVAPQPGDSPIHVRVLPIDDKAIYSTAPHFPWSNNCVVPSRGGGSGPQASTRSVLPLLTQPTLSVKPAGQAVIDVLEMLKLSRIKPTVLAIDLGFVATGPESECRLSEIVRLLKELSVETKIVIALHYSYRYTDGKASPDLRTSTFDDALADAPGSITSGFVNLDHDRRRIPTRIDGTESFALAITRRVQADRLPPESTSAPAARLFRIRGFGSIRVSDLLAVPLSDIQAGKVSEELQDTLRAKVLILGASWRKYGEQFGPLEDGIGPAPFGNLPERDCADSFWSKLGCAFLLLKGAEESEVPGVYAHASYVESLLSATSYWHPGEATLQALEFVAIALLLLVGLALRKLVRWIGRKVTAPLKRRMPAIHGRMKVWVKIAAVVLQPFFTGLFVLPPVIAIMLTVAAVLLVFGVHWDPTITLIVVVIHAMLDEYIESKEENLRCLGELHTLRDSLASQPGSPGQQQASSPPSPVEIPAGPPAQPSAPPT